MFFCLVLKLTIRTAHHLLFSVKFIKKFISAKGSIITILGILHFTVYTVQGKVFPSVDGHYLDIYYFNEKIAEMFNGSQTALPNDGRAAITSFYRGHRSHIVNLPYASKLDKSSNNYAISLSVNDYTLPISRSYLETVLSAFKSIH